jgi:hypothetical protein
MTCHATFANGTIVTLTAPPNPVGHNTFTGDCAGINTCTVVMNGDKHANCDFFRSSVQAGTGDRTLGAVRWTSRLGVPGATGQIVLNSRTLAFVDSGIAAGQVDAEAGRVLIEAELVEATGEPGTWQFELAGGTPGDLRVIAGQAALVTSDAVTFALRGRPGERAVFEFVLK